MQIERFFDELAPRLETARVLSEELDLNLAPRFNVLDYLRTDELGLSRIIADLLNPHASHGQGALFLREFLESLKRFSETPSWPDLVDRRAIEVVPEWTTDQGRKIDVVVSIEGPHKKPHCLALENKPYALDQENQVKDYLGSLEREFGKGFLLIYLPPTGEGPSSIPKEELAKWRGRFAIMPYFGGREVRADEFEIFRLRESVSRREGARHYSLADWLGECRKSCEVDRLRWFLADLERFCKRRFGGPMTTDSESRTVQDFVRSNPDKVKTAMAVYESWPAIKQEVCGKLLERLCSAIERKAKAKFGDDMQARCEYAGEGKDTNWICLYRECWAHYKAKEEEPNLVDKCTTICLTNTESGPNGWCIGVASPIPVEEMTKRERARRQRLAKELEAKLGSGKKRRDNPWWPWRDWVDEDYRNWDSVVPELHKEKGKRITTYFVDEFVRIAEAVPIIDGIERG